MSEDQIIECLNEEFTCVYCGARCKHKDAFGKLNCWYHPGRLETQEYFGDLDRLSTVSQNIHSTDHCRHNQTKWSCCGNREKQTHSHIGVNGKFVNSKIKPSRGCKRCDHQSVAYREGETSKFEHIPLFLINNHIYPSKESRGQITRVNNEYGIIDKSKSTLAVKRFE